MSFFDDLGKIASTNIKNLKLGSFFDSIGKGAVKGASKAVVDSSNALQKTGIGLGFDVAKNVLQGTARAGGEVGLDVQNAAHKVIPSIPQVDQYSPEGIGKTIFGDEPVKPLSTNIAETELNTPENINVPTDFYGNKISLPGKKSIAPLLIGAAALNFTGGGEAKAGAKAVAETAAHDVVPIVEEGKNIASKLIDQFKTFEVPAIPSDKVKEVITNVGNVAEKTFKGSFLNNLRETANVAAQYFGKPGADLVYDASKGAKLIADVQEKYQPLLADINKVKGQLAKTKIGLADASERIYTALENPDNATEILKSPGEQKVFDIARQVFEDFKQERIRRGESVVGYGYAPRIEIQKALQAPENILNSIGQAFGTKIQSPFSKERTAEETGKVIKNIFDILPQYINSQAKEFAYKDVAGSIYDKLAQVPDIYKSNPTNVAQGKKYLQSLFSQILNPRLSSGFEQFANKALQTTYKSQLGFSPKFHLQNLTQRILANSEVTKEGQSLAKKLPKDLLTELQSGLTSGLRQISQEAITGAKSGKLAKFSSETGNILTSFNKGLSQQVAESDIYKNLVKEGLKPVDAAVKALEDPALKDLAIRRGNVVVNATQFGANAVSKPELFREGGTLFGIPKSFLLQYRRFQTGMAENIGRIMDIKNARELDILKRGNPAETQIVDYVRSARALRDAAKDVVTAASKGEAANVSVNEAKAYVSQLDKVVSTLNEQVKNASAIRRGKSIANYAKMWGAAAAVQFLFDGGLGTVSDPEALGKEVNKSLRYGSPVNIPSNRDNPAAIAPPALNFLNPTASTEQRVRSALNFVPGVGLVVNRGRDLYKFYKGATGGK